MNKFSYQEVEFLQLPFNKAIKLLHPERAVLVYGKGETINIGALCYLRRSAEGRRRGKGLSVDLSTFIKARTISIKALIEYISEEFDNSGLRSVTLSGRHKSFIRFINWCDQNNYSDFLTSKTCPRAAFRAYIVHLQHLVSQNQLNNNTAAGYQFELLQFLEGFFGVDNLDQGINLLKKSILHTESTNVPDEAAQKKVLAWCKCLLIGFSNLVVDQKPYPFSLTVPGYLNWPDNKIWVFPIQNWCQTPDQQKNEGGYQYRYYDYLNGRLRTLEEVYNLYGISEGKSRYFAKKSQRTIDCANQDFYHHERIERGLLAVKAFAMLFIASTGMNPSQVFSLPWNEELEEAVKNPENIRQNFRAIKYRANSRPVSFEIGLEYMPHFRQFLLLRKYLLNGKTCEHLFFTFGQNQKSAPTKLNSTILSKIYQTLRVLTPTLPKVLPKEWRAAKQDHVMRNYDPSTASVAMQHSLKTALKKYSNGSEVAAQIEMSSYLNQVEKVVLKLGEKISGSQENSVGICVSPNNPNAIADSLPVMPNCDGAQGCLFCDKYRAHADEKDTRKLLSARFCIKIIASHEASSPEQFDRVFGIVLQRIEFILGEIRRSHEGVVEQVEREVDIYCNLDPIWQFKLEKLMTLGFEP